MAHPVESRAYRMEVRCHGRLRTPRHFWMVQRVAGCPRGRGGAGCRAPGVPGAAVPGGRPGGPGRGYAAGDDPDRRACAPDRIRAHTARNDGGRGWAVGPARGGLRVQDGGRGQRVRADQGAVRDRGAARSRHGARRHHVAVQGRLRQPAGAAAQVRGRVRQGGLAPHGQHGRVGALVLPVGVAQPQPGRGRGVGRARASRAAVRRGGDHTGARGRAPLRAGGPRARPGRAQGPGAGRRALRP